MRKPPLKTDAQGQTGTKLLVAMIVLGHMTFPLFSTRAPREYRMRRKIRSGSCRPA